MGGLAWTGLTIITMLRWTSRRDWADTQRFATVVGGVLACTIGGFVVFKFGGALRVDWIGKSVFDSAAIASLFFLGRKIARSASGEVI